MSGGIKSDIPPPVDARELNPCVSPSTPPLLRRIRKVPVSAGIRSHDGLESDVPPPIDEAEYNANQVVRHCKHCKQADYEHAKHGKCLYAPTYFEATPEASGDLW